MLKVSDLKKSDLLLTHSYAVGYIINTVIFKSYIKPKYILFLGKNSRDAFFCEEKNNILCYDGKDFIDINMASIDKIC